MTSGPPPVTGTAIVRGRDHPQAGEYTVEALGPSVAVGITAGQRAKPSVDPNEDAGAIALGPRASLLVVADAHFGCEASELAIARVLEAFGDDPPPADLEEDELVSIFFETGLALQRAATRVGFAHPNTRTTLALALVTDESVQWASLGDSCVGVAGTDGLRRLDEPRSAYLGYRFSRTEIGALTSQGRAARSDAECVLLATDGFVDVLESDGPELEELVETAGRTPDAALLAERVLRHAVEGGIGDAVTIAIAASRGTGENGHAHSP